MMHLAPARSLLLPLLLLATAPLAAQEPRQPHAAAALQRRDSARLLRTARAAQAEFERVRFRNLPWTDSEGGGDRCDEVVGRFCFTYGEKDAPPWTPPPEPARVRQARDTLLARLREAATTLPGDEWTVGQLVRYAIEAGRPAQALSAARACRAARGWCLALAGYVLHAAGDDAAAEAEFDRALALLPAATRREWTDLGVLLAPAEARTWRRMPPARRDSVARAFWRLADPLLSTPGNEARAEHLSRLVMARLQERARNPEGLTWGDDLGEFLLRYGQPEGWERVREPGWRLSGTERPGVVSHYAERSWSFLPTLRDLADPLGFRPGAWNPDPDRPRTQYALRGVRTLVRLDPQVAVFRRGAEMVVVAAYDLGADSVPPAAPVTAVLLLQRADGAVAAEARAQSRGPAGALAVRTTPAPATLALEARADSRARVGRARFGLRLAPAPARGVHLSDVLLLRDGAGTLPATLEEAIPLARADARVRPGERLGLFWEIYGLPSAPDTLAVSVRVAPTGRAGLGRRVAERLGLASAPTPVRIGWRENAAGAPLLARSLAVALPPLRPGDYALEVTVRAGAGEPVTATRVLYVERATRAAEAARQE